MARKVIIGGMLLSEIKRAQAKDLPTDLDVQYESALQEYHRQIKRQNPALAAIQAAKMRDIQDAIYNELDDPTEGN